MSRRYGGSREKKKKKKDESKASPEDLGAEGPDPGQSSCSQRQDITGG